MGRRAHLYALFDPVVRREALPVLRANDVVEARVQTALDVLVEYLYSKEKKVAKLTLTVR